MISFYLSPNRGFWKNRTKMEKNLIFLIGALFVVTVGLMVAVGLFARNHQNEHKVLNSGMNIKEVKTLKLLMFTFLLK